jgi:MFS family permease
VTSFSPSVSCLTIAESQNHPASSLEDTTIVNVALPSIRADLGFSQTSLAWVVNAYLLTFGGFLLLGGRLGDL